MKRINPAEMTANTLGILCAIASGSALRAIAILGGEPFLILGNFGTAIMTMGKPMGKFSPLRNTPLGVEPGTLPRLQESQPLNST
ncbi:hypothetical protein IJ00_26600 (plasmid) [Calothrix sp. 336/3]|nr:hypothetical protein IJ00_26600 [Calothrix sp. 336/3]